MLRPSPSIGPGARGVLPQFADRLAVMRASLDPDALEIDNHVALLPEPTKPLRVAVDLTEPRLPKAVVKVLEATGMTVKVSERPELVITDAASTQHAGQRRCLAAGDIRPSGPLRRHGVRAAKTFGWHVPETSGWHVPETSGWHVPETSGWHVPEPVARAWHRRGLPTSLPRPSLRSGTCHPLPHRNVQPPQPKRTAQPQPAKAPDSAAYVGPFVIDRTHPLCEGLSLEAAVWSYPPQSSGSPERRSSPPATWCC